MDGALVTRADDGDVDALVGADDGRIGLGAESRPPSAMPAAPIMLALTNSLRLGLFVFMECS